jgi:UDP-N-acetylglucosamine transferase subunit ALG13
MVDEAAGETGLSALIQTGASTYAPRRAAAVRVLTRSGFDNLVQSADYVITHAGAGSVMTALRYGKVPIIVPRRGPWHEHVNDHQQELAAELSSLGWVRVVTNSEEMISCLLQPALQPPAGSHPSNERMLELVADFIG